MKRSSAWKCSRVYFARKFRLSLTSASTCPERKEAASLFTASKRDLCWESMASIPVSNRLFQMATVTECPYEKCRAFIGLENDAGNLARENEDKPVSDPAG